MAPKETRIENRQHKPLYNLKKRFLQYKKNINAAKIALVMRIVTSGPCANIGAFAGRVGGGVAEAVVSLRDGAAVRIAGRDYI